MNQPNNCFARIVGSVFTPHPDNVRVPVFSNIYRSLEFCPIMQAPRRYCFPGTLLITYNI
jgi:hypothetical protein